MEGPYQRYHTFSLYIPPNTLGPITALHCLVYMTYFINDETLLTLHFLAYMPYLINSNTLSVLLYLVYMPYLAHGKHTSVLLFLVYMLISIHHNTLLSLHFLKIITRCFIFNCLRTVLEHKSSYQ